MTNFHTKTPLIKRAIPMVFIAVLGLNLSGCDPKITMRGNLPRPSVLEQVKPGAHYKQDIVQLLGTPSTLGTFDASTWYYISKTSTQYAFLEPEIIEQKVLALYFDDTGKLTRMQTYTKDDMRKVGMQDGETPTAGDEMGFLEQVFGNFGRFEK